VVKPERVKSREGETEERSLVGHGPFSGQVITTVREACRKAVLAANARLAEAMYLCEVSTTAEALGQVRMRVRLERAHFHLQSSLGVFGS
jgi:ribosome assembly protein 1